MYKYLDSPPCQFHDNMIFFGRGVKINNVDNTIVFFYLNFLFIITRRLFWFIIVKVGLFEPFGIKGAQYLHFLELGLVVVLA